MEFKEQQRSPILDSLVKDIVVNALDGARTTPEFHTLSVYVTHRYRDVHEVISAFEPSVKLLVTDQHARLSLTEPGNDGAPLLRFLVRLLTEATHGRFVVEGSQLELRDGSIEFAASLLHLPLGFAALSSGATGRPLSPATLASRVRQCVRERLDQSAHPSLEWVASQLGLSQRGLQRGLQGGPPFQVILAEVYSERAMFLLRERPDLSVKEIAVRLGFSGTRAFSRAYRRWFGRNPTESRRGAFPARLED